MSSHQGGQDWRANLGVKPSINPKPCIQLFANEAAAAYNFIYVRINLKYYFCLFYECSKVMNDCGQSERNVVMGFLTVVYSLKVLQQRNVTATSPVGDSLIANHIKITKLA